MKLYMKWSDPELIFEKENKKGWFVVSKGEKEKIYLGTENNEVEVDFEDMEEIIKIIKEFKKDGLLSYSQEKVDENYADEEYDDYLDNYSRRR